MQGVINTFRRVNIFIYLFPFIADMVVSQLQFISAIRLAQMNCSDIVVAGIWTVWSLPYVLASLAVGHILTEHNAKKLLLTACLSFAAESILFIFTEGPAGIALLSVASAVSAALFFTPFQIYMKKLDGHASRSLSYSVGMYTFAWSIGYAAGPFVSGFIMESSSAGWKAGYLVSAISSLAAAAGIWFLARKLDVQHKADRPAPVNSAPEGAPDLAWVAWIAAPVALGSLMIARSLFPAMAHREIGMPEGQQGTIMFLLGAGQALMGLILCRGKTWMYRASKVTLFGILGIAGLAGYAFTRSFAMLAASSFLFGLYMGSYFVYLVYHALAHPEKSVRYVSINEAMVGISGILAPLAAGFISTKTESYTQPFLLGCILLAVLLSFQAVVHIRSRYPAKTP